MPINEYGRRGKFVHLSKVAFSGGTQILSRSVMRQVPLEGDNIAINGSFLVEVAPQERTFTAMLLSRSIGTCLIEMSA